MIFEYEKQNIVHDERAIRYFSNKDDATDFLEQKKWLKQ